MGVCHSPPMASGSIFQDSSLVPSTWIHAPGGVNNPLLCNVTTNFTLNYKIKNQFAYYNFPFSLQMWRECVHWLLLVKKQQIHCPAPFSCWALVSKDLTWAHKVCVSEKGENLFWTVAAEFFFSIRFLFQTVVGSKLAKKRGFKQLKSAMAKTKIP